MSKKYFCISLCSVLALGVVLFSGMLVGFPFFLNQAQASTTYGLSVSFSTAGGTEDFGVTTYVMSPRNWVVTIPNNFTKVETAHYDKPTPDTMKKYMGWNGYLEVNSQKVWKFLSWSSATGGVIYDYALDQQVAESSGAGKWIDATAFFQAGENTVKYYHYTGGNGIGLKIRVTTGEISAPEESEEPVLKPDGETCFTASECEGGHCVNSYCRSAATYCGDGVCDRGETCGSCPEECGLCDGRPCLSGFECESGYCVNSYCRASSIYCGDKVCDMGESCENCSTDCGDCEEPKKQNGSACSLAVECSGGYCVNHYCRASKTHCGDKVCDTGETCSLCSSDCGECEEPKKPDMSACVLATECNGGYCVRGKCFSSPTRCMDNHCDEDKGETCEICPEDCACDRGGCCSPSSGNANLRGCVSESTQKGSLICCNKKYHYGDCCSSADCSLDADCSGYKCVQVDKEPEPEPEPEKTQDGGDCTADSQCEGGYCAHRICRSSSTFCGDNHCDKPENCDNCQEDCACQSQKCCSPTVLWADSKGCVVSNQLTKKGYICCAGNESFGECCGNLDCPGYDKLCINNRCVVNADCGNGYCELSKGENCFACPEDCSCYNSEACATDLARSDSYGCLKLRHLKVSEREKIRYIWCNNIRQQGQCCGDGDCLGGEKCEDDVCEAKVECGDWICQQELGENCKNCPDDCGCLGRECCEPRFASNAKGCVSPNAKITDRFICCEGGNYYGECCGDDQCSGNEECVRNWCRVKPRCGDSKCDYDRGENCAICPNDCMCYGDDCCAPDSPTADVWGCISTGYQYGSQVCCGSALKPGECCSKRDCSGDGQECINGICKVPEAVCGDKQCETDKGENCGVCEECACGAASCCLPSSDNSSGKGCVSHGEFPSSGNVCCDSNVYRGDCCSDSNCSAGEQCAAHRCTKFIEAFYRYYYEEEVGYGGKWVKPTNAYRGIAQFYKNQADYIDSPVIAFGQFVKILDTMSDAARSVVGADIIGLAIAANNFMTQMDEWYLSDPNKFQNTLFLSYSAGSLLLEAGGGSGTVFQDAAIRGLHSASPNNRVLMGVSSRHQTFKQKIGMNSKAAANQLFIINIADLVMDNTLLAEVDEQLNYDVLDYMQKIQLAMIANRLADLYQKADDRVLTEDEVFALIILEREFWIAVVARCTNTINFTEMEKQSWGASLWDAIGANYNLTIQTEKDIRGTAEGWLRATEERKNQLFREYFGYLEMQNKAVKEVSPLRALINTFIPFSTVK